MNEIIKNSNIIKNILKIQLNIKILNLEKLKFYKT